MTTLSATDNLPPGNEDLRKILAKRYAMQGIRIDPEEIVITAGALESLNLSLQAVTQPGDWVIVENPCFYGALQALERLRLKALSIAAHPEFGIDLAALEQALKTYQVRACWLMTNIQNPLGCTLSVEKNRSWWRYCKNMMCILSKMMFTVSSMRGEKNRFRPKRLMTVE